MKCDETRFLVDLFAELNQRCLRYSVMRNSELLPESLDGSDLDLLSYDEVEATRIEFVIRDVARRHGGLVTVRYKVEATILCLGGRESDGVWWGVHIDIFPGLMYFGLPYMLTDPVFDQRVLERESFYRCGTLSDVASFTKEILHNGRTKKQYYPMARSAYQANPEDVRIAMVPCFGYKGWSSISNLLANEQSADVIKTVSRRLISSLWLHNMRLLNIPHLVRIKSRNFWQRLRRFFMAPGYSVAFLGTDGSGKSTLIQSIVPVVEKMLHSTVHYEHLRPNLIPSLARLAGKPQNVGPTTNPHGGVQAGSLSSLVRFLYYYCDYTLGYWIKIHPILVKRATMVVFDRYYFEYMIDPRRCAVKLPRGFARFFSWFIPKPDLIICLGGDAEKIYARKPETSLDEVDRQVRELRAFCDSMNSRAVWVDTTESLAKSRDAVLSAILNAMSKRGQNVR